MHREAECACGQLRISVRGNPTFVIACSCLKCQRRTGSVLGVSSYFEDTQVLKISGEHQGFEKVSETGSTVKRRFCPQCGSTVFWVASFLEKHTGIAVGAFADPHFPEPGLSVWNQSRHPWLAFPERFACSETQTFD